MDFLFEITSTNKDFDGMAEGEFVDMMGRGVKLDGKKFSEFAANTNDAIEATRTESGEIVGLPIDARGHENGDGAGWIIAAKHVVRNGINLIRFTPKWTEIGRDLITKNIRRMFSPTVDLENNVIHGGSLTNWPATRSKKGRVILRPIELSQGVETMEDETVVEVETTAPPVETPATTPAPPANLEALLANDAIALQVREYVQMQIQNGVSAALETMKAENEIGLFVASLSLPAKPDEVKAFMLSLNAEQREKAKSLFTQFSAAIGAGLREQGHSAKLDGRTELSEPIKRELKKHLADGGSVANFFEINQVDLGAAADYNLAEFEQEQK